MHASLPHLQSPNSVTSAKSFLSQKVTSTGYGDVRMWDVGGPLCSLPQGVSLSNVVYFIVLLFCPFLLMA